MDLTAEQFHRFSASLDETRRRLDALYESRQYDQMLHLMHDLMGEAMFVLMRLEHKNDVQVGSYTISADDAGQ
ncbi:hypothetical protein [Deinococcus pimensis]|uniref:hypothetical protein n=1 Tax=Deinococcus pimensis TaxID=309888 RepID=UPI000486C2BC|nr:hypothetical protein [Deinococcus pimensis]